MATTPNPLSIPQQEAAALQTQGNAVAMRILELKSLPVSQLSAGIGQELIQDAKKYKAAVGAVFDSMVSAAYKLHRELTATRSKFLKPGEDAEWAGRQAIAQWEMERRRRVEDERRKKEAEALAAAEAARREELAHMKAAGAPAEVVEQRAAEPVVVA